MRKRPAVLLLCLLAAARIGSPAIAGTAEDQLGAWYIYFWDWQNPDSQWGFQGDGQYRAWDMGGDMDQLLLRVGPTYTTKKGDATFTLGYAHVTSSAFDSSGVSSRENRIYQEALLPQKIGKRVFLKHRFRYEQRWVENQDFRTRFRYALFLNVPFKGQAIRKGSLYAAVYNELFINGERDIGDGRSVELFDRNRLYAALGWAVTERRRLQFGYMIQTTDNQTTDQLQFSFHHSF